MGLWHIAVLSCHCDNPFCFGLLFSKRKIFNHAFIKQVVTEIGIRADGIKFFRKLATIATIILLPARFIELNLVLVYG
jgi:hypothetical protein